MNEGQSAMLAIGDHVLLESAPPVGSGGVRAVIVKIVQSELWLGLASPDSSLDAMPADQPVRLTVARPDGALLGESAFVRPFGGSPTRILIVVSPDSWAPVQRRAQTRIDVELPLQYRRIDSNTRQSRGKAAGATTVNLSREGLLLRLDTALSTNEEVEMTMALSGGESVSMLGVVLRAWVDSESVETHAAVVKFTRITPLAQERIGSYILATERRRAEAVASPPVAPAAPETVNPEHMATVIAACMAELDSGALPIVVGMRLTEEEPSLLVRKWFDGLMPGLRIEVLSQLQANMAGEKVPGAAEAAAVRPLAQALGLLAA